MLAVGRCCRWDLVERAIEDVAIAVEKVNVAVEVDVEYGLWRYVRFRLTNSLREDCRTDE